MRLVGGRGGGSAVEARDDRLISWGQLREGIERGEEDLGRWTLEELERCQKRTEGGWVPRKTPSLIPRAVLQELHKRRYMDVERVIVDAGVPAAQSLASMAEGREKANMARVRACEIILDRMLGKPKETVDVSIESSPLEKAIERLGEVASAVSWAGALGKAGDGRAVVTGWKIEGDGGIIEADIVDD